MMLGTDSGAQDPSVLRSRRRPEVSEQRLVLTLAPPIEPTRGAEWPEWLTTGRSFAYLLDGAASRSSSRRAR